MRPLVTQGGVVTMPRINHSVIAVDAEELAADVAEEFLESAGLPGLADPAREQAVTGEDCLLRVKIRLFSAWALGRVVGGKVVAVEVLARCVRGWDCSWDTRAGVACGMTGARARIGHYVR
jgi:hypothetical protein